MYIVSMRISINRISSLTSKLRYKITIENKTKKKTTEDGCFKWNVLALEVETWIRVFFFQIHLLLRWSVKQWLMKSSSFFFWYYVLSWLAISIILFKFWHYFIWILECVILFHRYFFFVLWSVPLRFIITFNSFYFFFDNSRFQIQLNYFFPCYFHLIFNSSGRI